MKSDTIDKINAEKEQAIEAFDHKRAELEQISDTQNNDIEQRKTRETKMTQQIQSLENDLSDEKKQNIE